MKRLIKRRLVLIVGITLLLSGIVVAQGWGGNRMGPRFAGQQKGFPGPGQVLRAEMYDAKVAVLVELSELSKEDIEAKLEYKPLWAVIDEAKVAYPEFRTKLHEKMKGIVTQAVTDGKLTKEQGDFMLERMEKGPGQGRGRGGFGKGRGHGLGGGFCGGNRW